MHKKLYNDVIVVKIFKFSHYKLVIHKLYNLTKFVQRALETSHDSNNNEALNEKVRAGVLKLFSIMNAHTPQTTLFQYFKPF